MFIFMIFNFKIQEKVQLNYTNNRYISVKRENVWNVGNFIRFIVITTLKKVFYKSFLENYFKKFLRKLHLK